MYRNAYKLFIVLQNVMFIKRYCVRYVLFA